MDDQKRATIETFAQVLACLIEELHQAGVDIRIDDRRVNALLLPWKIGHVGGEKGRDGTEIVPGVLLFDP
jgi:hypothetical protein